MMTTSCMWRWVAVIAAGGAVALGEPPEAINLRRTVAVEVVRKTKDAVVNISTTKTVTRRISPFDDDFFWSPRENQTIRVPASSLGSGFLIHREGYVVTNNHVVDRARQIQVELNDGRKLAAELVSADAEHDLAILKIASAGKDASKEFPTIELGDSSDLMIGEPVIAVGNPLGFSHSVSMGIVSAIHRDLKDSRDKLLMSDLVQTDAAINPGNSGGPLLNAYGQVIGINTAIRGDAQNIGFAIAVNRLRDLIPELMKPAAANKLEFPVKLSERRRVEQPATIISEVVGTRGDKTARLRAINGQACKNIVDAYAILLKVKAGQTVELEWDNGKERVTARPAPLPDAIVQARKKLGLGITPLTPMLAEKYQLAAEDGLLVTEVVQGSIAARAGIKPGDVVVQLARYRVSKLDDLSNLLEHLPETGRVRIGVIRGEQMGYGILEFGVSGRATQ